MSPPQSAGINPPIVEQTKIHIQIAERMGVDTTVQRMSTRESALRVALQRGPVICDGRQV
jgi:hypothetical protein